MRSGVSAIRVFSDKSTTSARGVDNRTSSSKTRQIHRIHGIGDCGSVAFSFLNLPLTHQTDHPEFWPVFSAIVLTHNYVSTAVLPSPRCAPFAYSAVQFATPSSTQRMRTCPFPALKRLRVMVVCMRAFIERNRINQHALQSLLYFLSVWMQLMIVLLLIWQIRGFVTYEVQSSWSVIRSRGNWELLGVVQKCASFEDPVDADYYRQVVVLVASAATTQPVLAAHSCSQTGSMFHPAMNMILLRQ